jgi:hypothetical protein
VEVTKFADFFKVAMEENSDLMVQDATFLGYRSLDGPQLLCLQGSKKVATPFLDFNLLLGPLS